jgi:mono/diheme cytochrome c family protein
MIECRYSFFLCAALLLAGCERDMRDMYDQQKPHADGSASRFEDGRDARPPPRNTVAHASGVMTAASAGTLSPANASLSGREELDRGRERYDIYCTPCHSPVGDGDGIVVRRGFPRPESFHTDAQRALSDELIIAAMVDGKGAMRPMVGRIDADDRAAIVAYVRALQRSQHINARMLSPDERALLERSGMK